MIGTTGGRDRSVDPVPTGRYRHYKGGHYRVLGVALHTETRESLVVYMADDATKQLWVRPVSMFLETVTVDGRTCPRFSRLPD